MNLQNIFKLLKNLSVNILRTTESYTSKGRILWYYIVVDYILIKLSLNRKKNLRLILYENKRIIIWVSKET